MQRNLRSKNNNCHSQLLMLERMRKAQQYVPAPKLSFYVETPKKRRKKVPHKPSYAKQVATTYFCPNIIRFIIALYRSLSYQQKVGLIFFAMFAGANAYQAFNTLKEESIKKACARESRIQTFNKPNNMQVTFDDDGKLVPINCSDTSWFTWLKCLPDIVRLRGFYSSQQYYQNINTHQAMRHHAQYEHLFWKKSLVEKTAPFQLSLNDKQVKIFNDTLKQIDFLRNYYANFLQSRKNLGGNCGEHAGMALFKILKDKLKNNIDIKIQVVDLFSSTSKESIRDHAFLLLDSNMSDITIENDLNAVQSTLNGIEGTYCDAWNDSLGDFKAQTNGLYKLQSYDSLFIETVSLEFDRIKDLSQEAQNFISRQLLEMDLDIKPIMNCSKKP